MWLPYSGISQRSHEGDPICNFNQCFTSTLNKISSASQPSRKKNFHYYMTAMNPNVKYIFKDKLIHTLDATKNSGLEIEKTMEESSTIPSSIVKPHFNERPRNEIVRNEDPRYETLPSQDSRMEERESLEMLKLLMSMNNQILSLNKK